MVIDLERLDDAREPFRVLLVSDRSVCRGPAVHRLLQGHLRTSGRDDDILLATAGTRADVGQPIHADTARALVELQIDPEGHRARQVTQRRLAQADLVLTADRGQRTLVTQLWPGADDRTFTLLSFARVAPGAAAGAGPADLVAAVREAVGIEQPDLSRDDDLARLDTSAYADHRRAVRMLDGVCRVIAGALSGRVPAPGVPTSV